MPGLDYFLGAPTFSEVHNAKDLLQALATRELHETRARFSLLRATEQAGRGSTSGSGTTRFREAIASLEQAIDDFEGTDQQLLLVQELLWFLKWERRYQKWMDVYLLALYRHPGHDVVGRMAEDALVVARLAAREAELREAFAHLLRIPLEFAGQDRIRMALGMNVAEEYFIVLEGKGSL